MSLQAIAIPAKVEPPQGVLVILHGWGANAQDVISLAPFINVPNYQILAPNAPFPHPYTSVGKMWYDLPMDYSFLGTPEFHQQPQLQESRTRLTEWLQSLESITGVPLARTVLAGFSQGGAMTLDVGIELPLAALMVLSGYLHAPLQPVQHPHAPPVLMVHGHRDQVVPLAAARRAKESLLRVNIPVQYHELNMGHEISLDVLSLMQSFIEESPFQPDSP